jgi:hypothetical protein
MIDQISDIVIPAVYLGHMFGIVICLKMKREAGNENDRS